MQADPSVTMVTLVYICGLPDDTLGSEHVAHTAHTQEVMREKQDVVWQSVSEWSVDRWGNDIRARGRLGSY